MWDLLSKWIALIKYTIKLKSPSILREKPLSKLLGQKNIKSEIRSQKSPLGPWSSEHFLKKSSYQYDFEKSQPTPQFVDHIKPTGNLLSTNIYITYYTTMSKVYTILFSRKFKTKKVRHHPSSVIRQNKTKVFGVKNEIPIKYKRIKWTPSRKVSLLLTGGHQKLRAFKAFFH